MNVSKSTSASFVQNMIENMILASYSDQSYPCHKLRWICRKNSNAVARKVETPGKSTIVVARHEFLVLRKLHYTITFKHIDAAIAAVLV